MSRPGKNWHNIKNHVYTSVLWSIDILGPLESMKNILKNKNSEKIENSVNYIEIIVF